MEGKRGKGNKGRPYYRESPIAVYERELEGKVR